MTTITTPKAVAVDTPYVLSRASDGNYVAGRRSFRQYRELGVTTGSGGQMRG